MLIKKTNNKQLNGLKANDMIVNDSKSIAQKFNEFFGSVAKEIDKNILESKRTYTESEIEKIINIFSDKKAVGPHSIPTNILKEYKKIFSIPLALIKIYLLKQASSQNSHVIPVYKKGDQLDCSKYRPMSLLSNISKVF